MTKMKRFLCAAALAAILFSNSNSFAAGSVFDLVGPWEGVMEFGKFKIRMRLNLQKTDHGAIHGTIDHPDQGMKGMPVAAILYNAPAIRLEIDPYQTAYNGTVASDGSEIRGVFEEGPGGRPVELRFKRAKETAPEPEPVYTINAGEKPDARGFWKSEIEVMPGFKMRMGMKIGRTPNGALVAKLDWLDQGMKDIPASSLKFAAPEVQLEWQALQISFNGRLSDDMKKLAGTWKMGPRAQQISFERLEKAATALDESLSYTSDSISADDLRGLWKGALEVQGTTLR